MTHPFHIIDAGQRFKLVGPGINGVKDYEGPDQRLEEMATLLNEGMKGEEKCWFIERRGLDPRWFVSFSYDADSEWSDDPDKAVRFSRKADAEAIFSGG